MSHKHVIAGSTPVLASILKQKKLLTQIQNPVIINV